MMQIFGLLMAIVVAVLMVIVNTIIFGALGAAVGYLFPDVIAALSRLVRVPLTGWEVGAIIGFVGSLLDSARTKEYFSREH